MDSTLQEKIAALAEAIRQCGKITVFTGAGISTESGIPDYRSPGGLWDQFKPVMFDDFMRSREARIEYWRQKRILYFDYDFIHAKPNAGHLALKRLFDEGIVEAVITQNIDGLHQLSGIPESAVIELHGSNRRVRCMSCGEISSIHEACQRVASGDPAPECGCGGYLKPDTISFGQAMPQEEMQRAMRLSQKSKLFLVIGSTLQVQPASYLPLEAKKYEALLGIINLSDTPFDSLADFLLCGMAGEILPQIADKVL